MASPARTWPPPGYRRGRNMPACASIFRCLDGRPEDLTTFSFAINAKKGVKSMPSASVRDDDAHRCSPSARRRAVDTCSRRNSVSTVTKGAARAHRRPQGWRGRNRLHNARSVYESLVRVHVKGEERYPARGHVVSVSRVIAGLGPYHWGRHLRVSACGCRGLPRPVSSRAESACRW